jgi:hypothetical protein
MLSNINTEGNTDTCKSIGRRNGDFVTRAAKSRCEKIRAVILTSDTITHTHNVERWLKHRLLGCCPEFLILGYSEAQEFAFLAHSQEILALSA